MKKPLKGKPVSIRFNTPEDGMLTRVAEQSGLKKAEIVRRAVVLLLQQISIREGKVGWIIDELAGGVGKKHNPGWDKPHGDLTLNEDDPHFPRDSQGAPFLPKPDEPRKK